MLAYFRIVQNSAIDVSSVVDSTHAQTLHLHSRKSEVTTVENDWSQGRGKDGHALFGLTKIGITRCVGGWGKWLDLVQELRRVEERNFGYGACHVVLGCSRINRRWILSQG